MTALSKVEKERLLKTLEVDREFRYALMGLLGFSELLDRFSRLEERQQRLEERQLELEKRQQKLEERFAKLEERFARLEERQQKLEERQQKLEERFVKLEERFARLEERFAKLEERQQKLEERQMKLEEIVEHIRRRQDLMALELGALTESFYSKAFLDDLKEEIKIGGDEIVSRRRNLRIDGEEIDLLVETKEKVYVVEVKVKPKRSDIGELIAKADLVRSRYEGKVIIPLLAGSLISHEIEKYAEEKGVKVYYY